MVGSTRQEYFPLSTRQFSALGTVVFVATTDDSAIVEAEWILRRELAEIDLSCSRFRPDSEINTVVRASGSPVRISQLLCDAVDAALRVALQTDGAVDPTVGSSLRALGYDRDFAELVEDRSQHDDAEPQPAPGWTCISLNRRSRTLCVPAGVVIDLGATAKAFAADRAAGNIAQATGSGVLINLGGDVAVGGPTMHGGWPIGLALDCATAPGDTNVVVSIERGGLASSGTTVRKWPRRGRVVHHIIDPRTGASAQTCWQLVSVVASTCLEANAASTASVVWGSSAIKRLESIGLPARLVDNDGSITTINGWPSDISPIRGGS